MLFAWVKDHCLLGNEGSRMEEEVHLEDLTDEERVISRRMMGSRMQRRVDGVET